MLGFKTLSRYSLRNSSKIWMPAYFEEFAELLATFEQIAEAWLLAREALQDDGLEGAYLLEGGTLADFDLAVAAAERAEARVDAIAKG